MTTRTASAALPLTSRSAITVMRRAGLTDRLVGKAHGGINVLLQYPVECDAAVQALAAAFPAATVTALDSLTVHIHPA